MKILKTYDKYNIDDVKHFNRMSKYYFKSTKHSYLIKICSMDGVDDYFSVGFGIVDHGDFYYDTTKIVNENPYEIMDTVFDVMYNFMLKQKNIKGFIFSFTGDKIKNEQRLKLYKRTIDKYFKESELEYIDGLYYLKIK